MTIAVSSIGSTLEAPVDTRFATCPWFVLVNPEDMAFQAVANMNAMLDRGSGIEAARMIANRGASVVLTASCGQDALETLASLNIPVVTGCHGTVRQLVERFRGGTIHRLADFEVSDGAASGPAQTVTTDAV